MSGRTLFPAAGSSTCTLLSAQDTTTVTLKNHLNQQVHAGATAAAPAPMAFATDAKDDFADFAWLDDEETDSASEEAAQALDDLRRLESVFGNTEVDRTTSSDVKSSIDIDADLRDEKTVRCMEDALEGDDTEGLLQLFDEDLQDALLALPDAELDSCSEEYKDGYCFGTGGGASSKTVDCSGYDTTSDTTTADCSCRGYDAIVDGSVSDSSVVGHATVAFLPPTDCGAQDTPTPVRGEDIAVDFNTADATGTGLVKAAVQSDSGGGGGGPGEHREEDDAHVSTKIAVKVAAPTGPAVATSAAAASADTVSPPGVPTRLLDAIDLWESANAHAKMRKKAAAVQAARERKAAAAAAAARGAGDHRGAVTTRSTAKKIGTPASSGTGTNKKKKNEFGKRRRSSGGGGSTAPVLNDAVAAATAGKTKGKGKGKGKGKKMDPLVAVRDARSLSRKPLIVQWLKSDGCDSDAEAEAALGKAVGSLSAISRYWGGGG